MNLIEDVDLKDTIEKSWKHNKLYFKGIYAFNTSWATDKNGGKDKTNRAGFVMFKEKDRFVYWLISEKELFELLKDISELAIFNRENDNTGKKWRKHNDHDNQM